MKLILYFIYVSGVDSCTLITTRRKYFSMLLPYTNVHTCTAYTSINCNIDNKILPEWLRDYFKLH